MTKFAQPWEDEFQISPPCVEPRWSRRQSAIFAVVSSCFLWAIIVVIAQVVLGL